MLNDCYLMYLLDVAVRLALNISYKLKVGTQTRMVFKTAKLVMTLVEDYLQCLPFQPLPEFDGPTEENLKKMPLIAMSFGRVIDSCKKR